MRRRSLLFFGALSPVFLLASRYLKARPLKTPSPADYRERAQQLNELAANIQTPADAHRLVDFIADIFSEQLPPKWTTSAIRNRIAQAEYTAVSDSERLISESRLSQAWSDYIIKVQAPEDRKATPTEINNLRDAFLTHDRLSWNRGSRNIWTVPSIYATQPDGKLASGCRAVESIRILWDLANMPDNLTAARYRVSKGELASDQLRKSQTQPTAASVRVEMRNHNNPVESAERQYIKDHGIAAYFDAVETMLNTVLT